MDFEKQLGFYREETEELLELLETSLLRMEESPEDGELLDTVFRAFHTIKGSSGMFGFEEIAGFTHELESVFDTYRRTKTRIPETVIRQALRAKDCIRILLAEGDNGEQQEMRAAILSALGGRGSDAEVFRIFFRPSREILKSGTSLHAILSELEALGECRFTLFTEDIPVLESLDPELCYVSWLILLSTNRPEAAIRDAFIFVEDQSEISITPVECFPDMTEPATLRLGEILIEQGSLDPASIDTIKSEQRKFGKIALEKGLTNPERISGALDEQEMVRKKILENNRRLESASIRVRNEKLDTLVNLVGELVTLQARLSQEAVQARLPKFMAISEAFERLTDDLRSNAMSIRMVPASETFHGFRRLVHDLSGELGKPIRLEISGGETELDKNVMGVLKDALMHLIRNSADHGIELPEARKLAGKREQGTIRLCAEHAGSSVEILVEDDGAGLDREKIAKKAVERGLLAADETDEAEIFRTIFEPGFSTAEKTTSISGRGVGMDVVKQCVEKLRGSVRVESEPGRGTRIVLSIPLTLAIMDGLLVRILDNHYIVNLQSVEECVDMTPELLSTGQGRNLILLRNEAVPYLLLREEFGFGEKTEEIECMVVTRVDGKRAGLVVDRVLGKRQTVIKPLPRNYSYTRDVSGSAILGDGTVALILDAEAIIQKRYLRLDNFSEERKRRGT